MCVGVSWYCREQLESVSVLEIRTDSVCVCVWMLWRTAWTMEWGVWLCVLWQWHLRKKRREKDKTKKQQPFFFFFLAILWCFVVVLQLICTDQVFSSSGAAVIRNPCDKFYHWSWFWQSCHSSTVAAEAVHCCLWNGAVFCASAESSV